MSQQKIVEYKVPFRHVYCATLYLWLRETLLCHVWYRIFKPCIPELPREVC